MQFLSAIGLEVRVKHGARGFVVGVEVSNGTLLVDPHCHVSAILHEAGHLALIPKQFRHMLSGDLSEGFTRIYEEAAHLFDGSDSQVERAMLQCSDTEVTAWSWAAGLFLGIPEKEIIRDGDYQNGGKVLRFQLKANAYVGINGISHAGFCLVRQHPYKDLPVYPALAFWLQP